MAPETETSPPEQSTGTGQPGPPQGPPQPAFGGIAAQIYGVEQAREQAAGQVRQGLEDKATRMEPLIAAAQKDAEAGLGAEKTQRDRVAEAAARVSGLPQPPSRQLTEFLAPVEGESPQASITKLLQAVGLFATGISGSARGDARAGLAAFTGAMKGWQEGDKERADRHFADWEAKSKTALLKWNTERATYQDIMEANNLSIAQRLQLLHLASLREDNQMAAKVFELGDLDKTLNFLGQREDAAAKFRLAYAHLIQSKEQFERAQTERERAKQEAERLRQQAIDSKTEYEKARDQSVLDAYPPELLKQLAPLVATGQEKLTGLPRTPAGNVVRGRAYAAAMDWAKEKGLNPGDLPALRAEMGAARQTLTTLEKNRGVSRTNGAVMEAHLDTLVKLGAKVDRSGSPVANRYQLYIRGEYGGDPDVALYQAQAYEVGQELAKFFVGTAQGDANSREEARRIVRGELNQQQLEAVAKGLHVNAKNRQAAQDTEIQEQIDHLKKLGGGEEKRAMPSPPLMRIRRVGTQGPVAEGPEGPVPAGWERVQ